MAAAIFYAIREVVTRMAINKEEKMLLLRACTIDDQQAVVVPEERTVQFEISGRSLLRKIKHMVGWEDDRPRMCYGEYLPTHQAIRFDLKGAQALDVEQQ